MASEALAPLNCRTPDEIRQRDNRKAGHTLCEHCEGTGNELYSMYRTCPECGGNGIAVEYGGLSALGKRWAECRRRQERKRNSRRSRGPRDWKLEVQWRLSRWLGIGHCFHGEESCRRCEAWASDCDYEMRRTGPFRCECVHRDMCDEAIREAGR